MYAFVETWEALDAYGEGYIPAASLTTLLLGVPPPLGVKVRGPGVSWVYVISGS